MADSPTGLERRMVHRLLVHWREAQPEDGQFPSLDDFLARDLGDILPLIYVLEAAGGAEPMLERLGESYSGEAPADLAGRPLSSVPENTLLQQASRYFDKVMTKKVPITLGGEFTHANGATILYRSIIVPLRGGGENTYVLLGAANSKVKEGEA